MLLENIHLTKNFITAEISTGGIFMSIKIDRKKSDFDTYIEDYVLEWLRKFAQEQKKKLKPKKEIRKHAASIMIITCFQDTESLKEGKFSGAFTDTMVREDVWNDIKSNLADYLKD